jgi:tRNA pseudouridine-54 N-methylase
LTLTLFNKALSANNHAIPSIYVRERMDADHSFFVLFNKYSSISLLREKGSDIDHTIG